MVKTEMEGYCDFDLHQLCVDYGLTRPTGSGPKAGEALILSEEALWASTKMQRLRLLLPQLISDGHRVLIFSQWTRLLDILEVLMNTMDLSFLRLDGQTPVAERQDLINDFNSDGSIAVFLLSTRPGHQPHGSRHGDHARSGL